jgi:hypothetical protein
MRRIRSQLTYANVMATIAVFIALGGGTTAVALSGQNTVQSDDLGPGAQVKAPDVANNAVNSADVASNSLTGLDIADRSGVDTCAFSARLGDLCFRAENDERPFDQAVAHCGNLNMRLPTYAEADQLARNYDLPNVNQDELFWTDEIIGDNNQQFAFMETDAGVTRALTVIGTSEAETACVATPVN